ncbi:MAG: murein hydrolase activator EnvC [Gemmatimonadota bacterium]
MVSRGRRRARRATLLAALGCGLLAAGALPARAQDADLDTQRSRLEQLQREIARTRAEAARLGRRETSVLGDLRTLERELGVTREVITTIEDQITDRAGQIGTLTRDLARAQNELAAKRQVLARRLRTIYMLGRFVNFEILLRAESFAEILARYKYLRLIAEQDARLVQRIARLERETRQHRASIEAARTDLADAREDQVAQAQTLTAAERQRQQILSQVKTERSVQLEAAEALEAETAKIQAVLATLERRRTEREAVARRAAEDAGAAAPAPAASTLTGALGTLNWPVEGEIIERFGRAVHPVYQTQIVNNGIDIRAARGTPVRAVEVGEVVYADWNGGYGLMVILDHAGGDYSLYAHLDRADVAIGQRVADGGSIGTVGESGSLVGPKLLFEIRQGGRAVDPIGWLRRR